ncbi:hypothetical protein CJ255_18400 [Candidatus Viridilinea mediisalina]|uniref:Sortase n=1 Tax=Candidatus Viridilinea mediisalina TaxID=2024553 RepID=A0A2A6RFD3_9CHLR|nr:hypothetical protein CJ255_18400 [Candidatus Viridilinea mediisalina]
MLLLVGCGTVEGSLAPTTSLPDQPTQVAQAVTSTPTAVPAATDTAIPESTLTATATSEPTRIATATSEPTLTATATPEPTLTATATSEPTTAPAVTRASHPGVSGPVRMVIPAINLDREILPRGLDAQRMPIVLPHDVVWYNLSARPGHGENVVLWGHVLPFRSAPDRTAPFARLKELSPGASMTLFTNDGSAYEYTVVDQIRATPDQVQYILPQGREIVTMVSCIGDEVIVNGAVADMTHRLITIAAPVR